MNIFLSPLVDAIIGNLVSAATDEIKMLWGAEEEVDRLSNTLSAIGAVLEDAEEKQVTSRAVNNWLRKLKDVAYDADDIVDDFAIEVLQAKPERSIHEISKRKQVSRFFSCPCFKKVVVMHEIGLKIKEVRQRLDDIAQERSQFHLKSSDGGMPSQPIERPKTGSLVDESEVFGRDDDKEKLIQILMTDDDIGKNFSVLPIVGMGGSGKTTLAQLLYNHTFIKNHEFEKKAWVCVSDSFDVARITKEIIESATGEKCDSLDLDPLQNKLSNILRGKKFIIVLDDVWNDDRNKWKTLCLPFNGGARGSKIIVTTRIDKIAQMMGTVSPHKVGVLSENDSWRLFAKMTFGGESSNAPRTLVNIGRQIVSKCGGLPLAIKTMGALLSSNEIESRWNNILLSKIWELPPQGTDDILPALRLSYQHLPSNLKQCFTYCSLFPKDYEFDRDKLVNLWIGEGYVKPRAGMEMEDVGQELFEDLLSRSFFQRPFPGSRYITMHDLVHDMAEFFSKEECVKIEGGVSFGMLKNARRTSIINQEEINLRKGDDWNKFNKLRTFIKVGRNKFLAPLDGLLDLLLRCKRLRVLSLRGFGIHELPNSIGNLKHLRYLDLSWNDIETLPESIGGLYNLQTLKLGGCYYLTKLPRGITNLIYLRHLEVNRFVQLPSGIGKLNQLVTLSGFNVGIRENECKLGELKDLVKLRGEIEISELNNVSNKEEADDANLKNKEYLQEVTLYWRGEGDGLQPPVNDGEVLEGLQPPVNDGEVLEGLQPPVNIRKLGIRGYMGDKLTPSWLSKFDQMITFVNLVEVNFFYCRRCKSLPPLGQLPSLKTLYLEFMEELRILGDEFCGDNGTFPSLEELGFFVLPSLEKWSGGMEGGGEYMPCLRELHIGDCPKLKQLPEKGLPTSLQSLKIYGCPILRERCEKETGEEWPKISHIPDLKVTESLEF